ncbi:MAG: VPLPA-CTERM sorting domain-containing protein [Gammaproteobacteria bacterium]|nr:VPLPA-CTERM sorting domain-containing protein [Gammaproteobacteria bacterium]
METTKRLMATLLALSLSASATASTYYLDRFKIDKNGTDNWFNDPFSDGNPPPSSEGVFPNQSQGSYSTLPDSLPGPEQNGKLALDPSQGQSTTSSVSGNPILIQRARLQTSTDSSDLTTGLKSDDTFSVGGLFDLTPPEMSEVYGIRLTDFSSTSTANDVVQLTVGWNGSGEWGVRFREADFGAGIFDLLDFGNLSQRADLGDFEQIALFLDKADAGSSTITASYALIDLDDSGNNQFLDLAGSGTIFDGEEWTRAEFFTVRAVPVPAALPLFASALGLLAVFGRSRRTT